MRYIDVRGALNGEEVAEKLLQEIERQKQFGVQYWKVMLKETESTIDCCGLRPYDLDKKVYELGFHFMRVRWGCGYASEAARAVIHYAFSIMHLPILFAGHNPKKLASATLLPQLGFRRIEDRLYEPTGHYHPSYELDAKDVTF